MVIVDQRHYRVEGEADGVSASAKVWRDGKVGDGRAGVKYTFPNVADFLGLIVVR
jgi:hypothetical protein